MKNKIKFRALKDDMSNCDWVYGQLVYKIDEMDGKQYPAITQDGVTFTSCLPGTEGQLRFTNKEGVEYYDGDICYIAGYGDEIVSEFSEITARIMSGDSDEIGDIVSDVFRIDRL